MFKMIGFFCLYLVAISCFSVQAGQGVSCLGRVEASESEGEEETDQGEDEVEALIEEGNQPIENPGPMNSPFYNSDLRPLLLSYLDVPELRAFERVNRACRKDAYEIDERRRRARWKRAGVHLVLGVSPAVSQLFGGKGQIFEVGDFILSGRSKRKMNWKRAVGFCRQVGAQMSIGSPQPTKCEVLDDLQWQKISDVSRTSKGLPNPTLIPEMDRSFWSKTPSGTSGAVHHTFDGRTFELGFGFLLPRFLFLLRSEDVHFFARCACNSGQAVPSEF